METISNNEDLVIQDQKDDIFPNTYQQVSLVYALAKKLIIQKEKDESYTYCPHYDNKLILTKKTRFICIGYTYDTYYNIISK